jgi:hypothetical protein
MQSGRDTLASIDTAIGRLRRDFDVLDADFRRAGAAFADVRQAQLGRFAQLAKVRLRELESGELLHSLDDTDRRVKELLTARKAAEEKLAGELEAAKQALAERERERAAQQTQVEAAAEAVDDAEAEAQTRLAADREYQTRFAAAQDSDAVADQAEAKAQAAEADRLEKGKPYESDPVFTYLWQRGFGTPRYRAWPATRLLDRWAARQGNFENLRRNYGLLTEIPRRLAQHAERMRAKADRDLEAVRELEQRAAEAAGVPARQQALDAAERRLGEIDGAIDEQENVIDTLLERQGRFAAGEDEYWAESATLLRDAFQRAELPTLRERAAGTRSQEDDRLVDELEDLEDDRQRLEQELVHYRRLHEAQRERLLGLEDVRKRFKRSRYDDVHSVFVNGALIGVLLDRLLVGSAGTRDVWQAIEQQQRFRQIRANPRFGTGGFPRAPVPPPWRMPGGGQWRGPKGGGFGGGGFRTGGGIRKGGFRTGGGF